MFADRKAEWSALPADAAKALSAYLRIVDEGLPGRITGLYLVGSLALDDYHPGQSDVDFVAVTEATLTPAELGQLAQLHRGLRRAVPRPKLDGVYVTWPELRADPATASAPCCHGGRLETRGGFAANPVTWTTLHRHGLALRGPARPAVRHDEELLRSWCCQNLQTYWAGWVRSARTRAVMRLYSLTRQATVWGVLGVTRLHATINTGDILSKSAAGRYALEVFPVQWWPVVHEALGARVGGGTPRPRNPFARRRDMLAFMEVVIRDSLESQGMGRRVLGAKAQRLSTR